MEYKRYKPKYERPFGMGAFFDYGAALTKHLAAGSLRRMTPWRKKILAAQQRAEEVWDAEGGNSQTRIAPRPRE